MYQYASKDKIQSKKSKTSTLITNKSHRKTGIKMPVQTQFIPKQERREIQPIPTKRSEELERPTPCFAKPNNTGIPLQMKEKFENLSGFSSNDVQVHYNSDKPAQLQTLAYTQGNQVYVASEQEAYAPPVRNFAKLKHSTIQEEVAQLSPDYTIKAKELEKNPRLRAMQYVETRIVTPALNRLTYRYGGSFAAYFQGGEREPRDIDIEMENPAGVQAAAVALRRAGGVINFLHPDGLCAVVLFLRGRYVISCDIVDENNARFNERVLSPEDMGETFDVGSLSSPLRLIINYLDRAIATPDRAKEDFKQIKALYKQLMESSMGEYAGEVIVSYTRTSIKDPEVRKHYLKELSTLLREARIEKTKETPPLSITGTRIGG